jgi:hypothetical protein
MDRSAIRLVAVQLCASRRRFVACHVFIAGQSHVAAKYEEPSPQPSPGVPGEGVRGQKRLGCGRRETRCNVPSRFRCCVGTILRTKLHRICILRLKRLVQHCPGFGGCCLIAIPTRFGLNESLRLANLHRAIQVAAISFFGRGIAPHSGHRSGVARRSYPHF